LIFHSLDFALFLVVFLTLYWALPERAKNPLLLAGSYFFYGYVHPWFLLLLAGSTLADYSYARAMARFPERKRFFLVASLSTNLGLLGTFKYFDFFATNVAAALGSLGLRVSPPLLGIALPVGISFYTFQSLSYTIDVYRGRIEARRSLLDLATFLALFPQLVAGPIERATTMLPQVEATKRFDPEQAWRGLLLMAWGFAKKLVVADNVALIANKVFALSNPTFSLLWVGTLAFGVQIYADFSAYSDIARGTARLLGFELMKNFDHPYLSESPAEFWRRWHISLSTWFRDYVYIPLGGSRGSPARTARNLMLTFLLSGFWHGASWNFLMWGGYHGGLLVAHRALERRVPWLFTAPRLRPIRILVMFVLVNVGWLMFRETELSRLLADLTLNPFDDTNNGRLAAFHLLALTLVYSLPVVVDSVLYRSGVYERVERLRAPAVAGGVTAAFLVLVTAFLHSEASSDFIYFQF
jgi:D-alanyl-lipoteichoic acid acyltransferase DltB (MBOAT superfamily)